MSSRAARTLVVRWSSRVAAARRRRATARLAGLGLPVGALTGPVGSLAGPAAAVAGIGAALVLRAHPAVAAVAFVGTTVSARHGLHVVLARQARIDRARRLNADLPVALDLIGACLAAGAPIAEAVSEVGAVLDGELSRALRIVGRALRRGVPAARAWAPLEQTGVPPAVAALARAAVRTATTGSALEVWIAELAVQSRAEQEAEAVRAAHRAGVLAVLPLGLCALPAYVLLAVVPAVAGLLRHLHG